MKAYLIKLVCTAVVIVVSFFMCVLIYRQYNPGRYFYHDGICFDRATGIIYTPKFDAYDVVNHTRYECVDKLDGCDVVPPYITKRVIEVVDKFEE